MVIIFWTAASYSSFWTDGSLLNTRIPIGKCRAMLTPWLSFCYNTNHITFIVETRAFIYSSCDITSPGISRTVIAEADSVLINSLYGMTPVLAREFWLLARGVQYSRRRPSDFRKKKKMVYVLTLSADCCSMCFQTFAEIVLTRVKRCLWNPWPTSWSNLKSCRETSRTAGGGGRPTLWPFPLFFVTSEQLSEHKQVDRGCAHRERERRGHHAGRKQDRPQGAAAGTWLGWGWSFRFDWLISVIGWFWSLVDLWWLADSMIGWFGDRLLEKWKSRLIDWKVVCSVDHLIGWFFFFLIGRFISSDMLVVLWWALSTASREAGSFFTFFSSTYGNLCVLFYPFLVLQHKGFCVFCTLSAGVCRRGGGPWKSGGDNVHRD